MIEDTILASKINWGSKVNITLSRSELLWVETCMITANIGYKHHNNGHAVKKTNKVLDKISKVIRSDKIIKE